MAKISGINTNLRGQIGAYLFRKTKYGTIVSEAPTKRNTPVRTESQMYIRTQWVNLAAIYRQFNKTLKKAYEGLGNTMSVYNAFVAANINVVKVFLTKKMRDNGGSVLAPYQITRGTLPSINYSKNGSNVLVTDISLGSLTIDANTEVGELAETVIANNPDFAAGDQISFFYGRQTVDSVTGTPRARIDGTKVVLDVTNTTPLWDVVGSLGFATVDGYLGMSRAITDGAAAWVHSRETDQGNNVTVGTQSLYVDSSVLAAYQTDAAFMSSADSYGGINSEKVFLDPGSSSRRQQTESVQPLNPSQNENENQNQNGGGSSSGNSGNTGGNSGNSGSSETFGTPVLTISKSGSGSATVSAGGGDLNTGAEVAANTEVTVTITPAAGKVPSATIGGNTVTLTENDGTYTGTFQMPSANATLVINTGSAGDNGDTN